MATLLVTNDFPPTVGGIQSYLRDFVDQYVARRGADAIVVFASTQDAAAAAEFDAVVPYTVVRWPRSVMLPTPATARKMSALIREFAIDTVWFGAAAPLAVMGMAARRAGAHRVVSTTHGHEVGWSMVPVARMVLRRIGTSSDVVTYISEYTRNRFSGAFGSGPRFVPLPSGVDIEFFRPASEAQRRRIRAELSVGEHPLVVVASRLVPRKGQDQLILALPAIREVAPGTQLVIIGEGRYEERLRSLARKRGVAGAVHFLGRVPRTVMRDAVAAADVVAMPARTRGGGLDVEGLGIVYLEAQACGVPVVAGASGGAPEAVGLGAGDVVNGRDVGEIARSVGEILINPGDRGQRGRAFVAECYSWEILGERLTNLLDCQASGLE